MLDGLVRINPNDSMEKHLRRNESERPSPGHKYNPGQLDTQMFYNKSAFPNKNSSRSMASDDKDSAWAEVAKFN